jgi:cytochrome oxidase Cu insertion factor (SCO1/SenC/PrrC family)
MLKKIRYAALAVIAALAVMWAAVWWRGGGIAQLGLDNLGVSVPGGVSVGGPFTLVDTTGATVTDATFRGRWMLVYFGYTYCPDVCPTELQTVVAALDAIGPRAERIVPVFITIDPERDTPAALAEYVKLFDDRLVGLTGTKDQVAAAARAYRVYYARANAASTTAYLMDHSSFIYLIGPDGGFRALFRHGISAADLADALKARLAAGG